MTAAASSQSIRTLFCGTPSFAVPTLRKLIDSPFRPVLVITQPDRPRGRGQKVSPSPVKRVVEGSAIPVYQPEKFNSEETLKRISECGADLAVIVAYSAKIGNEALGAIPQGWLNLHPSFLPAYRGAAPLQWALMSGETETGLTTFFVTEEWDAGYICFQETLPIGPDESYGELAERCAEIGAELVLKSVRAIDSGTAPRIMQDDSRATFAPRIKPDDSVIDWKQPADAIRNRIRGLSPDPGAYSVISDKRLYLREVRVLAHLDPDSTREPGEVVRAGKQGLVVVAGEGFLDLLTVQPESKSVMSGKAFVNGYRIKVGDRFEDKAAESET